MTSLDKLRSLSRPIVFGYYSMKDDVGGVTTWLERLLLRLHRDGVPVKVLLHHIGGTDIQDSSLYVRLRDAGISVEIEKPPIASTAEEAVRGTLAFLNRHQPQVFLPQCVQSMYYAAQIAGRAGLPWAFVLHSDDHSYWNLAEVTAVESSGGMFVGVSEYVCQQAVQRRLARHPKVIPCGVPIPGNTASFSNAPFRVAYSGRIVEEQKRISLVLEAMSRACKQDSRIECWIMGDGPARASSEQWVRGQGLSERIHFLGRLEPSAVQAKLVQCQAILLMSDYEGFGLAIAEAMAIGVVPVVRAILPVFPALVKDNETGILVDATPEQAAKAIIRLANTSDLWSKCSAASRALVTERYSEEACYLRWIDVIAELCERSTVRYPIVIPKKIPIPPAPPIRWRLNRVLKTIRQWLIKQWYGIFLPVALYPRNSFRKLYQTNKGHNNQKNNQMRILGPRRLLSAIRQTVERPFRTIHVRRIFKLTDKRPLYLIIETVNTCNAHCVFCCYGKTKLKPQVLSLDIFEKVIREYSEMGSGAVSLTPVPGEILLDPYLIKRYEILAKYKNIDQVSFTTNGIAFEKYSDEELKYILKSSYMIQISIGGLDREGYKSLYQVDQFENVLNSVSRLLDLKKAIGSDVHIHLSFRTNNPNFEETHREQLEAYKRQGCLVSHISWYGNFGGLVKSGEVKDVSIVDSSELKKNDTCVYPLLAPSVLPNGLITNCGCVDVNGDSLIIGDARHNSLRDCWSSKERKKILDSFRQGKLVDICRQCSMYRSSAHLAEPVYKNIRSYQKLPLEFYMMYGG